MLMNCDIASKGWLGGEGMGLFERSHVHPENPDGAFSGQRAALSRLVVLTPFADCRMFTRHQCGRPIADS